METVSRGRNPTAGPLKVEWLWGPVLCCLGNTACVEEPPSQLPSGLSASVRRVTTDLHSAGAREPQGQPAWPEMCSAAVGTRRAWHSHRCEGPNAMAARSGHRRADATVCWMDSNKWCRRVCTGRLVQLSALSREASCCSRW